MRRTSNRQPGRGGRGRGRGNRPNYVTKTPNRKKGIEDYYFYVGSTKQASDFESTYEFLLNYIKKTYTRGNDISEALRKLEVPDTNSWKPSLEMSIKTEPAEKATETRQFELEHKAEYDEFMKRKKEFKAAYSSCFINYFLPVAHDRFSHVLFP